MRKTLLLLVSVLLFVRCEDTLLNEEFDNTPPGVYSALWNEFDRFYGAFEAKNINWDSLKVACSSGINNNTTDLELFEALCNLMASLNDGHANIVSSEFGNFCSWGRRDKSYFSDIFSLDVSRTNQIYTNIIRNYLNDRYAFDTSSGYLFFYGIIAYGPRNIGYLYIPTFSGSDFPKNIIQQAAVYFKNADAVIIDLRYNTGGTTDNFVYALNMFVSESKLYLKSKFRNGPKHSDFTNLIDHRTDAGAAQCKNKPIAILANSYSASSSEHFILGLKSQPDVILVGDTTYGAFSEVHERVLPNGWVYRLGAQVVYTPDGKLYTNSKGLYIEGNGIAPDYYITDQYYAILNGKDKPLDKALFEIEKRIKE